MQNMEDGVLQAVSAIHVIVVFLVSLVSSYQLRLHIRTNRNLPSIADSSNSHAAWGDVCVRVCKQIHGQMSLIG